MKDKMWNNTKIILNLLIYMIIICSCITIIIKQLINSDIFKIKKEYYSDVLIEYEKNCEKVKEFTKKYIKIAKEKNNEMFDMNSKLRIKLRIYSDFKKFSEGNLISENNLAYSKYNLKKEQFRICLFARELDTNKSNQDISDFSNAVLHEYTHYRMADFAYRNNIDYEKVPAWFNEGVAVYNSGIKFQLPSETISFSKLITESQWIENYKAPYYSYAQSYCAINYLINKKGINIVKEIILDLKQVDFNESYKINTGKNIEDLENDLKRFYK